MKLIRACLTTNLLNFKGRASRKEYWLLVLAFYVLILLIASFHEAFLGTRIALSILFLLTFTALISTTVRRLHDINKSGWLFFLRFIPFIGEIIFLILMCKKGTQGPNKYGFPSTIQ